MEFHVSRRARDHYQFDQSLYQYSGNVIFANMPAARAFAQKMNQTRDLVNHPEQTVHAGEINAMGLIDEILHHVLSLYREQRNPQATAKALDWLKSRMGSSEVDLALTRFATEFPPLAVYQGHVSLEDYLAGSTNDVPNEQVVLEEMLMLWLENKNPAFDPFKELFDDTHLAEGSVYLRIMAELYMFFETQPRFGPHDENLIAMLRAPAKAHPNSLNDQLTFIRDRWSGLLGRYLGSLLTRLLTSLDSLREEQMQRGFFGPGPVEIPVYDASRREMEAENFSPDLKWMPRLVLVAKNIFVWLDQLSQQYGRRISRLDEIPDEELEKLSRWGFTGLWLIGVWERSRASARIKQQMGNPEALASAYSLYDYRIADELGGEDAFRGLRDKAWRYGIRLASDMVPNHMGIDSPWVVEHPEWFLSLDYPPYPSYSFTGPNLSDDNRAEIHIEDHYYTKTDASVVFQDVDKRDGHTRYIYHGNDGTTIPWNDTAQLNYLNPAVREQVIQTILAVARRFPIIRFDAAMTLAKQQYQRLWFPTPGTGGAIPSRSDYSLTKEQFDQLMPVEFWREVVERVAQEAPDTLLLAEAFWLMESYFVRTLGMHRVYNSAFMNLLRNEENAKYRTLMKNTLEFDPEILRRYVNFMNNPDERTAVDQFGKGDKYFGIVTVMATIPGLPMFGHGQVEGYSEKYGMEFKRAYWNEQPDPDLVARHEREIFPLLHHRAIFAGVENFLMYDFITPDGSVNEEVYAYSNALGNDRGLVIYNNKFADTQGAIHTSVGYSVKGPDGQRHMLRRTLGEGLGLHNEPGLYCIFRDQSTNLEYLRPSKEIIEQGLSQTLHAYEYHAYLDFREVADDAAGSYRRLNEYLSGRGVPSILNALEELLLQPVLNPLRAIVNPDYFQYLLDARLLDPDALLPVGLIDEARNKLAVLIDSITTFKGHDGEDEPAVRQQLLRDLRGGLRLALSLPTLADRYPLPDASRYQKAVDYLQNCALIEDQATWVTLFSVLFLHGLGQLSGMPDYEVVTSAWLEEWQFNRCVTETAHHLGVTEDGARGISALLKVIIGQQRWFEHAGDLPAGKLVETWLADPDIQVYLKVNRFKEVVWFDKERFETFMWWMALVAVQDTTADPQAGAALLVERLLEVYERVQKLLEAEAGSEYQVAKLLQAL